MRSLRNDHYAEGDGRVAVETKTLACAGLAGIITALMLLDASGLVAVVGWMMWALALAVVLGAVPPGGGLRRLGRRRKARPRHYSLVRQAASELRSPASTQRG